MQNTFTIDADIKKTSYFNEPTVTSNDDITFVVNISDDGQAFDITNVTTVSLANTKPDNEVVVTPGVISGTNQVTFNLGTNETAVSGSVGAVVQLYDVEGRVSTLSFSYAVKSDPTGAVYVPSADEQTLIEVVLNDGPLRIQEAIEAGIYANLQGDYALAQGDIAANESANLSTLKTDVQTATTNANTQGDFALAQGTYAKAEADRLVATDVSTLDVRVTDNTAQLADIAINIKSDFGAAGDYNPATSSGTDDTNAILNAVNSLKDGDTLKFPSGIYAYSSHLLFDTIAKRIKLVGDNAILFDVGQDVLIDDATQTNIPLGIEFKNIEYIKIDGVYFDNNVTRERTIDPIDKAKRVPQVDFNACKYVDVRNTLAIGKVGSWVTVDSTTTIYTDRQVASFFRFVNCETVHAEKNGMDGDTSGGGEYFGFIGCKHINWFDGYHVQGTGMTFWSFGKVIACDNVRVNGHKVTSTSTGSFIDCSGLNMVIENLHIDYPNGKLIDITLEWGAVNGSTKNLTMENCSTNGNGVISAYTINSGEVSIENIKLDKLHLEVPHENAGIRKSGISVDSMTDCLITSTKLINYRDAIYCYMANQWQVDLVRNIVLDKCEIIANSTNMTSMHIDCGTGKTTVRNSHVESIIGVPIYLNDRYQNYVNSGDLTTSKAKLVFENTSFKNADILIKANVDFIDCKFENCKFLTDSTGIHSKPTVVFSGDFEMIETDTSFDGKEIFDFKSGNEVKFKNFRLFGSWYNPNGYQIFGKLVSNSIPVIFEGGKIDLTRVKSDGSTTNNILLYLANETSLINMNFKNLIASNQTIAVVLDGAEVASPTTFSTLKFINCEFEASQAFDIRNSAAINGNNRLNLLVQGSGFISPELTNLKTVSNFNKFVENGNTEW